MASPRQLELMMSFEEIEHTADWAFRVRGRNLAELFENAARAMSSLDGLSPGGNSSITHEIKVEGVDRETLLVNWLNEILYLGQNHGEVYDRFQILEVSEHHLRAQLYGRPCGDRVTHIKAATFHNLEVKHTAEGYEATVVLDV